MVQVTHMDELMTRESWIAKYNNINNSFKRKMVFRIGAEAGFFSEYNNMVLAALYCLNHSIKFTIHSDEANFSLKSGWTDFFLPFCPEVKSKYNIKYNVRPYQVLSNKSYSLRVRFYKFFNDVDYLTQDLWNFHRDKRFIDEVFNFPELGIANASLLDASKIFIKNIWVYSEEAEIITNHLKNKIEFTTSYISMHIRSGDKFLESELFNIDQYMQAAFNSRNIKNAFVLTDDYNIIELLKNNYPDWIFQTLCDTYERGYFHQDFIKLSKRARYEQHLKLFASLDICAKSDKFIGTYSSNPGMYMGMRIGQEKCHCLDFKSWVLW